MDYKNLLVEKEGYLTVLTFNRPEKMNVLNREMIEELAKAMEMVAADNSCRVLLVTGSGGRAFCAGGDISYLNSLEGDEEVGRFVDTVHDLLAMIEGMDKVVIAAIEGYCLGAGLEFALACDIRVAAEGSVFGFPEGSIGIIPGGGGTYRLPAVVGLGNAAEMILTGKRVDPTEAFKIGLINAVTEKGKALEKAKDTARAVLGVSKSAIKEAKKAIYANAIPDYLKEKEGFEASFRHPDRKKGMNAFLEKRKPEFG